MKQHRKNDILLIVGLLIIALIASVWFYFTRTDGRQVVVRVDGTVWSTYSLTETVDCVIDNGQGGTNHLHVEGGMVWLEEASCPDKICVQQGKIRYAGESIICLPNKLVVEVVGEDELHMDGVTN